MPASILVTAGNTSVPLDQVRVLTNRFSGRTGASIAIEAWKRGHRVTLLTSQPETTASLLPPAAQASDSWRQRTYHSFDDLANLMAEELTTRPVDILIHSAAVSDYLVAGVFAPQTGTTFDPIQHHWSAADKPTLVDRSAGKIPSAEPELWLRLVRAPKLIDRVRRDWNFRGLVVKFKLEVGKTIEELRDLAERSRQYSEADLMVANTLEQVPHGALLGPIDGEYTLIPRAELPERLLDVLAQMYKDRNNGKRVIGSDRLGGRDPHPPSGSRSA